MEPQVKIFADVSTVLDIQRYAREDRISGFTTNPTLVRKGGASDYRLFALEAIESCVGKPLSLEVVADDHENIMRQGEILSSWGQNVVVKIPITTTSGESCLPVVRTLLDAGNSVNVTAVMTDEQVSDVIDLLTPDDQAIISVFAGRIADAGIDPAPRMARYAQWIEGLPQTELLWASPREVLNIVQAAQTGCDIITLTPELLGKINLLGKDLQQFSLDTVQMFYDDALSAGLQIAPSISPLKS